MKDATTAAASAGIANEVPGNSSIFHNGWVIDPAVVVSGADHFHEPAGTPQRIEKPAIGSTTLTYQDHRGYIVGLFILR